MGIGNKKGREKQGLLLGLLFSWLGVLMVALMAPGDTIETASPLTNPSSSAAARLAELQRLLDHDLISQQEYDERRSSILRSL